MTAGTMELFQQAEYVMAFKFVGNTSRGQNLTVILPEVLIIPAGAFNMVGDDYAKLDIEGEVLANETTQSFGTLTHPDTGVVSPLKELITISRGICSVQVVGRDSGYRDVGEVPSAIIDPKATKKDYWSNRGPRRSKIVSSVDSIEVSFKMTMSELSFENLLIALSGVIA